MVREPREFVAVRDRRSLPRRGAGRPRRVSRTRVGDTGGSRRIFENKKTSGRSSSAADFVIIYMVLLRRCFRRRFYFHKKARVALVNREKRLLRTRIHFNNRETTLRCTSRLYLYYKKTKKKTIKRTYVCARLIKPPRSILARVLLKGARRPE